MTAIDNILTAPDYTVVCQCSGVTKGEILACINDGAYSLKEIREQTGACIPGTVCGSHHLGASCAHNIVLLLAHHAVGKLSDMPQYPMRYKHAPVMGQNLLSPMPGLSRDTSAA